MANNRVDPVSYRKFDPDPQLATGLLDVARDKGDLQRRVAMGMAAMADDFGRRADAQAQRAGERAGQAAALANPASASAAGSELANDGTVRVHLQSPEMRTRIDGGTTSTAIPIVVGDSSGRISAPDLEHLRPELVDRFKAFQGAFGQSIPVVSGFRDVNRNARAGGAKKSQHIHGNALDLDVSGMSIEERKRLIETASRQGFTGIGVYENSIHLDLGNRRSWGPSHHYDSIPDWAKETIEKHTSGAFAPGQDLVSKAHGPVQVARVVQAPQATKQGFRPTGRDTIYGRAYDVSGTATYLQQLKLTMIEDQAAVYDKYKDDPALLKKALGELEQAHLREHVFPEIEADYKLDFGARALGLVQQAKAAQEIRVKAQDKADFFTRSGVLEDEKSRALVALRPDDATSVARLHDLQNSVDAHYDAAVARGILDPMDAAEYKEKSRGEMTVGFYMKQAEGKNADEIRTMRADMATDYGKGELPDIRGEDWDRIERGLTAAEQVRRTQDKQANASMRERGKALVERHSSGVQVTPEELSKFQLDAGTAPEGPAIVQSTLSRLRVAEAIRTSPVHAVENGLEKLLKGKDGAVNPDDLQASRDMIARHKAALAADPLGVAEKFGLVRIMPPLPVDGSADPKAFAEAFGQRSATAQAVAEHYGVPVRYFRSDEVQQINDLVKADPQKALTIAGGLVASAGRNAPNVLRELGENAPAIADAGDIINASGNTRAALDLLSGYGKTPEGKAYPDMPNVKRKASASAVIGSVLMDPQAVAGLDGAAAAIARKRLYDQGIDPKSEDALAVYERAFQEAAGATFNGNVQFGGFVDYDPGWHFSQDKVIVPASMRADKFHDVIQSLTDDDIGNIKSPSGRHWSAADLAGSFPVAVEGGYAFAQNDPGSAAPEYIEWINPANGRREPFVLDIAAMKDKLASRVPGAWR